MTLKLKEGYVQYDRESDCLRYHFSDGSSMCLNSSDTFYVWCNGKWEWTTLYLDSEHRWRLGAMPKYDLYIGEKVRAAVRFVWMRKVQE